MDGPRFEIQPGPDYTYVQIARNLESRIRAGEFAPGARLPNEREMAASYEVALGTIRRAIRVLADAELLIVMPHKGVFITQEIPPPQA